MTANTKPNAYPSNPIGSAGEAHHDHHPVTLAQGPWTMTQTTSQAVIPAEPGWVVTQLLTPDDETIVINAVPIVGWLIDGTSAIPILPYGYQISKSDLDEGRSIIFGPKLPPRRSHEPIFEGGGYSSISDYRDQLSKQTGLRVGISRMKVDHHAPA